MPLHLLNTVRRLALLGLGLGLATLATAQTSPATKATAKATAKKPVVILFVGNSFFHGHFQSVLKYNTGSIVDENAAVPERSPRHERGGPWGGIPAIFKKLTDEAGMAYEVHLESISGMPLKFHYDSVRAVVDRPGWDAVVLQEHSMWTLPARRTGHPDLFQEYGTRLEQTVHARNPKAKVYLYETWARADQTYPEGKAYSGLPVDSMTQDLHRGYYSLAKRNGHIAGVAPAGDAWLRAIQEGVAVRNPYSPEAGKVNLWGADNYHPSNWGSYLNACVLFAEITGQDPRKLGAKEQAAADLGIAPEDAVRLQRIAAEQVRAARKAEPAKKS
ncbi:DUF4886 domain-containing protein [Hymenobacter crusticola]|uniref:PEP-CTERM sorting domain-containing protein n=1 Tax=Hymenobacter crusticola TaxID=1770526 RepID=A0A243WG07_9BACT|nr:DUF4886 domain-containing protein [Hymenobacter crusticola]OUJ74683.1 hypothetical protein BXP70_07920 [Hymenobacter crusticola]